MLMMRTRLIGSGAVVTASILGVGATAGVAGAAGSGDGRPPATLAGIQAAAATAITQRVNALNAAIAKVNAATGLGSGQAMLDSYLGTDIAPLQALNTKIQGDTTVQQARADYGTIFSAYRVYLLVLPAARLAADADRATNTVLPKLTSDVTKLTAHVQKVPQLQPLIDDMNAQIGTATSATNGLASTVLGYTPAELNGNFELLSPAKSDDQTADAAIKKARQDAAQAVQLLRQGSTGGAASAGNPTTTS